MDGAACLLYCNALLLLFMDPSYGECYDLTRKGYLLFVDTEVLSRGPPLANAYSSLLQGLLLTNFSELQTPSTSQFSVGAQVVPRYFNKKAIPRFLLLPHNIKTSILAITNPASAVITFKAAYQTVLQPWTRPPRPVNSKMDYEIPPTSRMILASNLSHWCLSTSQ